MLSELTWLRPAPDDFREAIKALRTDPPAGPGEFAMRLVRLALHNLDEGQLGRLAAVARGVGADSGPLSRLKLGIVGDGTLSLLGPAIAGAGLRHGLLIDVVTGEYGSAVQEANDPESAVHRARLDMALLVLDYRLAGMDRAASSPDAASAAVDMAFRRIRAIVEGMQGAIRGQMLVQTLAPPLEPLFGGFDRAEPGSVYAMVDALNARLAAWARQGGIILVDIARLAASVGYERWDDPRHWHMSKLGFSPDLIPVYADVVTRTLAAACGKAKKALVLDLDNTLWGGVIGDDGVDGIALGQGSATGEAFLAVQHMALEFRRRGVVLAVCSKNEEKAARAPFRDHPDMLIKEDQIAVFQANWNDKATNLRAIAEALNIGVDALVLLDDNPAERAQVRQALPLVGVPELPDDPALYPRILAAAGYFDLIAVSDEDRIRADLYQANNVRENLLSSAGDMDSYLVSLEMSCVIADFDAVTRTRVAQLVNKSNQFNLTTRRYSEVEIAAIGEDPGRYATHARLIDRFGDNGIISVVICDKRGDIWEIDSWLMSCRVLGRRVEEAVLADIVAAAHADGATRLVGRYIASAKNHMVERHYAKLGFTASQHSDGNGTLWQLDLASYDPPELPMSVDRIVRVPGEVIVGWDV